MHMVWKSIGRVLEVFVNFSITITSKKSNLPQMHIGMEERGVKVWKLGNTNVKAIKNDIGEPPPPPDYVTAPTSKGFAQLPMDPLDFHRRCIYSNIFKVLSNNNFISRFSLTKLATTWGCNMTLLTPLAILATTARVDCVPALVVWWTTMERSSSGQLAALKTLRDHSTHVLDPHKHS